METAATTRPEGARTGADTEATPASRSATLWAHPRRRTALSIVAVQPIGLLPREEDLRTRSGEHRQRGAHRDGITQSDRPLGGSHADADVTLATEQLRALVGVVAQRPKYWSCRGEQAVFPGRRRELGHAGTEDESALHIPRDEPMMLERNGQSMGRRPGQPRGGHELRKRRWTGLKGGENGGGLVQDADPTAAVHVPILPSHEVRRQTHRRLGS